MSKEHKTTEFSAHISRSKVRKYLHEQLNETEKQSVEMHLKHCTHCSEMAARFVESEEPECLKLYMKKLKGVLVEDVKPRGPHFSTTQLKAFRAAAAVVILFSFSFFVLKNYVNKDFNLVDTSEEQLLPDLQVAQKTEKVVKTSAPEVVKASEEKQAEDKQPEKKEEVRKPAQPVKKPVNKTKQPVAKKKPAQKAAKATADPEKQPAPAKAVPEKKVQLASTQPEKKEVANTKAPKEEESPVAQQAETADADKTEQKDETAPQRLPLQKIEKVNTLEQKSTTQAQEVQTVPSTSIGTLRQQK